MTFFTSNYHLACHSRHVCYARLIWGRFGNAEFNVMELEVLTVNNSKQKL